MDTALWRWLTTPNCDTHSHIPHQQLRTNVAQRIEDFHRSPLIIDQLTIHQPPQMIRSIVDVIRIGSIERHIGCNLQSDCSNVEVDRVRSRMRSVWRSVHAGQQTAPLKHVGYVELGGVNWI